MKYLFWLLILLLVWWAVRRARQPARHHTEPAPTPDTPPAQNMAVCLQCGVHLPREEAVAGSRGLYCCVAHRTDAHDQNPD